MAKVTLNTIKKSTNRIFFLFVVLFLPVLFNAQQKDSLPKNNSTIKVKPPKHYFLNTVFANYYAVPKRELNSTKAIADTLKDYSYSQVNTGFYIPLFTKDKYNADSTVIKNWHLLLTGNFLTARPVFSGLSQQHTLFKYSLGLRTMYNNGKKDVFFFDISPFASKDKLDNDKAEVRGTSTFIWSRIVNENFSFRLGYMRTFLFGDRYTLPYLGVRFGRLDKTYISIQFPRNIFINIPLVKSVSLNVLAKPVGGVFNFKDVDSLYNGTNKSLLFGRRDICFGAGVDFHPSKFFSLFVQGGLVTGGSSFTFYSKTTESGIVNPFKYFYHQKLSKSAFINVGLTLRFGKSKSSYGNKNIYELQNMNSEIDAGDNNQGPNSSEITPGGDIKKLNKLKFKDLADIIDDSDLYD